MKYSRNRLKGKSKEELIEIVLKLNSVIDELKYEVKMLNEEVKDIGNELGDRYREVEELRKSVNAYASQYGGF